MKLRLLYFSHLPFCPRLSFFFFFSLGKQRLSLATPAPVFVLLPMSWSLEAPHPPFNRKDRFPRNS